MSHESNIFNERHNAIFNALMKDIGQLLLIVLKDKDTISASIEEHINTISSILENMILCSYWVL